MSKFIRTNEGIYELKENMTIETGIFSFFGKIYNTSEKHLFRNDKDLGEFVSQADTIEELCDEFVFHSDTSCYVIDKKHIEHAKATILKIYKENDETDYVKAMHPKFYGAIWTDKGLIYVAKLNEKGELELI